MARRLAVSLVARVRALVVGLALVVLGIGVGLGCTGQALPIVINPQACGNPCATLNCPAAYRCQLDGHCAPHCEPEQVGNRP